MAPRAPKHCSVWDCMNRAVPGQRNCVEHGNSRWPTDQPERYKRMRDPQLMSVREFVMFERGEGVCQIGYVGICTYGATDLDHIIPDFKGGGNDVDNLQAACGPCHRAKSSDEGHEAQGHKSPVRQRIWDQSST